jgi:transcription antitermination factor NusA-like protein
MCEEANMPLMLFVPQFLSTDMNDDDSINKIVRSTNTTLKFIESTHSPELNDSLFIISGRTFEAKVLAFEKLLDRMIVCGQNQARLDLRIGIPNSLVCILIGKRGAHVERIQKLSNTFISVIGPKVNLTERIVQIEGKPSDCVVAVKKIYGKLIDQVSPEGRVPHRMIYKFLIPDNMVEEFPATYNRQMRSDFDVDFRLKRRVFDNIEEIQAVIHSQWLSGDLKDCRRSMESFVYKVDTSICHDPRLLMIIPRQVGMKVSQTCRLSSQVPDISFSLVYTPRDDDEIVLELKGTGKAKLEAVNFVMDLLTEPFSGSAAPSPPPQMQPSRFSDCDENPMTVNITVPDSLVARLIGRKGEKVKIINDACGCHLSFQRPVSLMQHPYELKTPQGQLARMCTFKGTPSTIADGLKMLLDQIIRLEKEP